MKCELLSQSLKTITFVSTMINYHKYIHIDADIRFGKPCIKRTRITVYDVLSWMANGRSIKEIIADFPELNTHQILACLAFAANR